MTLHYAPTTPEEEELALALALSASLSSAPGKAVNEAASARSARRSESSLSSFRADDREPWADQGGPAPSVSPRPASFSGSSSSSSSSSSSAALNPLSLSLNPSLIYPHLPPPTAVRKPNPPAAASVPPRPTPAASSSANALLQRPGASGSAQQRLSAGNSPLHSRWTSDSPASAGSPRAAHPLSALGFQPGRSTSPLLRPPPHQQQQQQQQQYPPPHFFQPPPQFPPPAAAQPPPAHYPLYPPPQHLPRIVPPPASAAQPQAPVPPAPPLAPIPRSKSAAGPSGLLGAVGGSGIGRNNSCGGGGGGSGSSSSTGGGIPAPAAAPSQPPPLELFGDPDACAGCGRGFGLLTRSWVTGMGRKWHAGCFKCGFCREPISSGKGAFSYQIHPGDPLPYHPDCYKHVHHPMCHVCGTYITASPDGVISYRENGFWRERYCTTHPDGELTRCCACSRLQKQGEEWAPLPDGRPLCLQCLSSVVLDTRDAQPLYDEVMAFFAQEMRLPHAYKPPLLLVDGGTLNSHAAAEGRDDSAGAPVFHVRGLCVAHVYSQIPSIMRGVGGTIRSVVTDLLNPTAPSGPSGSGGGGSGGSSGGGGGGRRAHCHVKVLLLLYGLPRLLSGSIMAHELMHAWLRMEGVVGLPNKVEEGLCQLMACLWLDRQHELLKGKPEEQRLASFFSYQIRTDTSEVYGEGFREAMEAFQAVGLTAVVQNVQRHGRFTA